MNGKVIDMHRMLTQRRFDAICDDRNGDGEGLSKPDSLESHLRYIVPEIRLALIKEPGVKPQAVHCPLDMEKFVDPLKHYAEEHFVAFHIDVAQQVIGYHVVSKGSLTASLVHPREVFKSALLSNSHSIMVAHNHPAGGLLPSRDDISVTETLIGAGKLMDIQLIDHIIVSSNGIASLRESHGYLWC